MFVDLHLDTFLWGVHWMWINVSMQPHLSGHIWYVTLIQIYSLIFLRMCHELLVVKFKGIMCNDVTFFNVTPMLNRNVMYKKQFQYNNVNDLDIFISNLQDKGELFLNGVPDNASQALEMSTCDLQSVAAYIQSLLGIHPFRKFRFRLRRPTRIHTALVENRTKSKEDVWNEVQLKF